MERSCYNSYYCALFCEEFTYYFCMDAKQIMNSSCALWKIYGKESKSWLLGLPVINIITYALILHYKYYFINNETTTMTQELVWMSESACLNSGCSWIYSLVFKGDRKYMANYSNLIAQNIKILKTSVELITMDVSGSKSMSEWKKKNPLIF